MTEPGRKNWIFYALATLFFVPPIAAWIWYFYFQDVSIESTSNYGELVEPPRKITLHGLKESASEGPAVIWPENKWVVLLVSRELCDLDCENILYQSRQVRTRLGKDSDRVVRIFVSRGEGMTEALANRHADAKIMLGDDEFFNQFEKFQNLGVYVIDPRQFIVLHYPAPLDPAALYKDLRRLLKYSKIG